MSLHRRDGRPRCTTAAPLAVTATDQRQRGTANASSETNPQAQRLAALADSGRRLTGTTGLARQTHLLERARLWEHLAQDVSPTWAQTYRNVASVCRQEADTLNTSASSPRAGALASR